MNRNVGDLKPFSTQSLDNTLTTPVDTLGQNSPIKSYSQISLIDFDAKFNEIDSDRPCLSIPSKTGGASLDNGDSIKAKICDITNRVILSPSYFADKFPEVMQHLMSVQKANDEKLINYDNEVNELNKLAVAFDSSVKNLSLHAHEADTDMIGMNKTELLKQSDQDFKLLFRDLSNATKKADDSYNSLMEKTTLSQASTVIASKSHKTHMNAFSKLISTFFELNKLIEDNALSSLESEGKFNEALFKTKFETYKKSAEKVEKKAKKQKLISKVLSIFGAIVSAVAGVCSLIASLPTGGASLSVGLVAFASVALLLTTVDLTLNFAIDFSPTGYVFGKTVEGISIALEHTITKLALLIAKECGASESDLEKTNTYMNLILSNIIVLAAVAGACVYGGSKMASSAIGKSVAAASTVTTEAGQGALVTAATTSTAAVDQALASTIDPVLNTASGAMQGTSNLAQASVMQLADVAEDLVTNVNRAISTFDKIQSASLKVLIGDAIISFINQAGLGSAHAYALKDYHYELGNNKLLEAEMKYVRNLTKDTSEKMNQSVHVFKDICVQMANLIQNRQSALKHGYLAI